MTAPNWGYLAAENEQAAWRLLNPSTNWGPYTPTAIDVARAQVHATLAVSYRMAQASQIDGSADGAR